MPTAAPCISACTRCKDTRTTARTNRRRSTCNTDPHTRSCWSLEGRCEKIAGQDRLQVNSLHWQGVETLGSDLLVEARAPDGVIEAFRVADAPSFALGVQWHPEWQFERNPFSRALFAAFGEASRRRATGSR